MKTIKIEVSEESILRFHKQQSRKAAANDGQNTATTIAAIVRLHRQQKRRAAANDSQNTATTIAAIVRFHRAATTRNAHALRSP